MNTFQIKAGDCRDILAEYPENHFDAVICDPPYGLEFMGKGWDKGVPGVDFWREIYRVAKPGAHLIAFGGTRTFHRLTVAIEDSGWAIRDCLSWIYGSGFPKSHDISKAIEAKEFTGGSSPSNIRKIEMGKDYTPHKLAGVKGFGNSRGGGFGADLDRDLAKSIPIQSVNAKQWQGWGTALKPAWEPIILARKPLCGTVAENVLAFGTGGLNIDACRVGNDFVGARAGNSDGIPRRELAFGMKEFSGNPTIGRWPANVIHDGSPKVLAGFPESKDGIAVNRNRPEIPSGNLGTIGPIGLKNRKSPDQGYGGSGSAARFFYCAKASKRDRDEGLEGEGRNTHPTVKPSALMRHLCRLVSPPGATILDPFCGSGSTGKAALLEGFSFVGIDLDPAHCEIAAARCLAASRQAAPPEPEAEPEADSQLPLFEPEP